MAAFRQQSNALPDEIVKEIFAQSTTLIIPRERFIQATDASPFVDSEYSSSASLFLVCKQWLRIATPLLYHTIILRSKAQAQALERTFIENKELGKFTRRLRLEGIYGSPMAKIIHSIPQITDLFLTLSVWPAEDPSALIKSLPLLNPTTLILYEVYRANDDRYIAPSSKAAKQLYMALFKCLKKWKVQQLGFPWHGSYELWKRDEKLANIVATIPTLHTVHIQYLQRKNRLIEIVGNNPSLKLIQAQDIEFHGIGRQSRAWKLVRYQGKTLDDFDERRRPAPHFAVPIPATDKFDENIWKRILDFAMTSNMAYGHERYFRHTDTQELGKVHSQRMSLIRVCKTFHRLGLPHLYHQPILSSAPHLNTFVKTLKSKPELTEHVKGIMLSASYGQPWKSKKPINLSVKVFSTVFSQLRLVVFGAIPDRCEIPPLPIWAFEALCENSGETLQHLYPIKLEPEADGETLLECFGNLKRLRTLSWTESNVSFVDCAETVERSMLETLQEFEYIENSREKPKGPSLLSALCYTNLPVLRTLRISSWRTITDLGPFITTHGSKITTLHLSFGCLNGKSILHNFPNMQTLVVLDNLWNPPPKSCFECSVELPNLTKIIFELGQSRSSYFVPLSAHSPDIVTIVMKPDPEHVQGWTTTFDPSFYACFPALQEIQVPFRLWPTTERALESGQNPWPAWAEKLLEGGIKMTDCNGKRWIPRLRGQDEG